MVLFNVLLKTCLASVAIEAQELNVSVCKLIGFILDSGLEQILFTENFLFFCIEAVN